MALVWLSYRVGAMAALFLDFVVVEAVPALVTVSALRRSRHGGIEALDDFNDTIDLEEFNNETNQMMLAMAKGLGFYTCLKLTTTLTNQSSAKVFESPTSTRERSRKQVGREL